MYGHQQNGAYHRIKVVLDANSIFLCLEQSAFAYYDSDLAKNFSWSSNPQKFALYYHFNL